MLISSLSPTGVQWKGEKEVIDVVHGLVAMTKDKLAKIEDKMNHFGDQSDSSITNATHVSTIVIVVRS